MKFVGDQFPEIAFGDHPYAGGKVDAWNAMSSGERTSRAMGNTKQGPGDQLQMFMTPNEVMAKYQPLDGDRTNGYRREARGYGMSAEYTGRSANTLGSANKPRADMNGRLMGDSTSKPYWYHPGEETDTQLYSRKLEESQLPAADYSDVHNNGQGSRPGSELGESMYERSDFPVYQSGHTGTYDNDIGDFLNKRADSRLQAQDRFDSQGSLYDSIKAEGAREPIHLGTQFGEQGRPQVAGGHHRLAAQADIDPDQPMPVIHHQGSTFEARKNAQKPGGYKYS